MKKIFLGILIIISAVCIGLDGWFGYLHFFGDEKVAGNTFILSGQTISKTDSITGEVVTEEQLFCNMSVYENAIEIKFTNLMDENASNFFSYGIQLICKDGKTIASSDLFDYSLEEAIYNKEEETYQFYNAVNYLVVKTTGTNHYTRIVYRTKFKNFDIYEYQSYGADYETPQISNYLMSHNEFFKIQFGNEIYGMKFKDYDLKYKDGSVEKVLKTENLLSLGKNNPEPVDLGGFWKADVHYYYEEYFRALDINYFIEWLVNCVSGLQSGLETENYFRLPDIFSYYKYNEENGSYTNLITDESEQVKLYNDVANYFRIGVKVNKNIKLESAKESMFKILKGNMNYGEDITTNYEVGRYVLKLTNKDLNYTISEENKAIFTIKEEVYEKYSKYKSIYLSISINLDDQNLTFGGFNLKEDSKFVVYKIVDSNGNDLTEVAKC